MFSGLRRKKREASVPGDLSDGASYAPSLSSKSATSSSSYVSPMSGLYGDPNAPTPGPLPVFRKPSLASASDRSPSAADRYHSDSHQPPGTPHSSGSAPDLWGQQQALSHLPMQTQMQMQMHHHQDQQQQPLYFDYNLQQPLDIGSFQQNTYQQQQYSPQPSPYELHQRLQQQSMRTTNPEIGLPATAYPPLPQDPYYPPLPPVDSGLHHHQYLQNPDPSLISIRKMPVYYESADVNGTSTYQYVAHATAAFGNVGRTDSMPPASMQVYLEDDDAKTLAARTPVDPAGLPAALPSMQWAPHA